MKNTHLNCTYSHIAAGAAPVPPAPGGATNFLKGLPTSHAPTSLGNQGAGTATAQHSTGVQGERKRGAEAAVRGGSWAG